MKLMRIGTLGREVPCVEDNTGQWRDVSSLVPDFDPSTLGPRLRKLFADTTLQTLPAVAPDGQRVGSPLSRPGTIFAIGLNYRDHAAEAGMAVPSEPVVFSKAASSLSGPNDPIRFAAGMSKLDWEVELGIVIGAPLLNARSTDEARAAIFGYVLVNDVSERSWQLEHGGQWIKGKSYPSFCPTGPWLVTADAIPDPQALKLWLDVDGTARQRGTTSDMIFPVFELVRYLSSFAELRPGDLIITGTPAGVGAGFKPPLFLSPGNVVTLGNDLLGSQRQIVTLEDSN